MSHFESAACCHRLLKRLPEIQWRLPYWPKGYMSLIPPGLFFIENDWTPSHAIAEIKRHIMRLLHLDLSTAQAFYLSQKIETQIHVLVLISQKLKNFDSLSKLTSAVTRKQYIQQLKAQETQLHQQRQALEHAVAHSKHTQKIEGELKKVAEHLQQLEHMIAMA